MLTRTGKTLRNAGAAFAVGGLLFGNWPVFGAASLLLLLVASSTLAKSPRVTRRVSTTRLERGGRVVVELDVETPRGLGVVEVHQQLPEEFELVSGSNFHALTLGWRKRQHAFRFEVQIPKRGEWLLPPVGVKVLHPAGLATTPAETVGEPVTLLVEPRPLTARIPRDLRARAKRPFPEGDLARLGVATNDFRELREYVPGDPPRRINWKATARRVASGASEVPLVNETEWEGKKAVWIVVDGHARLSAGTNIEDAREHAADAALSLMELYLRRGYQVGLSLARSGDIPPLRFGTGESHIVKARARLAKLHPEDGPGITETLERDGALLHRFKPLIVLVTRLAGEDEDLKNAITRMGALSRMHGRNLVPGLIVDVEPEPLVTDTVPFRAARRALAAQRTTMSAAARSAGVRVAGWNADREPLEAVLTRGRIL